MKRVLELFILLASLSPALLSPRLERVNDRKLLLVSFDGFRWDFLRMYNTSWFHWVAKHGATTKDGSYIPSFATLSYPNHFTMVTGLHEETHGVVANTMFNPDAPRSTFSLRNKSALRDAAWYGGEPLWITAEKNGKRAGTFFWPGSEAEFDGVRPKFWKIFDSTVPFRTRVDTVVNWMSREEVQVAALYIEEPDIVGHRFGPFSKEMNRTIWQLNALLGYLIQRLKATDLLPSVNLVITSDHGMALCNASNIVRLYEDLERRKDLMSIIVGSGAMFGMKARPRRAEQLFRFMENLARRANLTGKFKVYRKKDIPERFHYRNNRRITDVIVLAEEGIYLQPRRSRRRIKNPPPQQFGCHGYDNELSSMRPFFAAMGPQVRSGARVPPFAQVDLYNLLTRLAGIPSLKNNGTWSHVEKLYRSGPVFRNVYGVAGGIKGGATVPLLPSFILILCGIAALFF